MPQLVVGGDDLTSVHQMRGNVGDVALEPHQRPGPGDGGLIKDLIALMDGDKTRALGTLLTGDDGPGPVGLSGQGLAVPSRTLLGVDPYRPPRTRVSDRVPHWLGLAALVPLGVQASFGGDGVNDLSIGEGVTFPAEMGLQIRRGPGGAGPDDEPQPRLIQRRQVGRREHACVSDHHELLDAVGGLECLHDGNDRGGLGLVALPAADLERKTCPVNQQAHDDLRVDPTLLGVTDLAQVVLTLGLEVQGGDACRHRARPLVAVT